MQEPAGTRNFVQQEAAEASLACTAETSKAFSAAAAAQDITAAQDTKAALTYGVTVFEQIRLSSAGCQVQALKVSNRPA